MQIGVNSKLSQKYVRTSKGFKSLAVFNSTAVLNTVHVHWEQFTLTHIIIHSKYFPDSDWLKAHAL